MRTRRVRAVGVALVLAAVAVLYLLFADRGAPGSGVSPVETAAPGEQASSGPAGGVHALALMPPLRFRRGDERLTLRGTVVDLQGNGVAGAEVVLSGFGAARTRSGPDGAFAFGDLVANDYHVEAHTDDAAATPELVHLAPETEPVVLTLAYAAAMTIEVRAAGDGRPIAGAHVDVLPHPQFGDEPVRAGVTDADGVLRLRGLAPGDYGIVVTADGYQTHDEPFMPQTGLEWSTTVELAAGVAVSGQVLDRDGRPVAGAIIQAMPASIDSAYSPRPRAAPHQPRTGDRGRFSLALAPGRYTLRATHPDFLPGVSAEVDTGGGRSVDGVDIALDRGARIRGRVVDPDGVGQPGAVVRVNTSRPDVPHSAVRTAVTDRDGRFSVGGLPFTDVEVVAATGQASSDNLAVELGMAREVADIEVELVNSGVIAGVVVDAEGSPVADAQVVCVGPLIGAIGLRPVQPETTDAGGRFACRGLIDGDFELTARAPYARNNQSPWARSTGVPADTGDTDLVIVLPGQGALAGTVVLPGGRRAPAFGVSVDPGGRPRGFRGTDGRFLLEGLAPGEYEVEITAPGHAATVTVMVPEGGTEDTGPVELRPTLAAGID